jgi:quercetin 2,3-dioxygenase
MKQIHKAHERGRTKIEWLDSYHSFSFGDYFDAKKMSFGALRVLNDDIIAPGKGFGRHPHANMEIVTIVLDGSLAHEDSMGTKGILRKGEVQCMSAGSGIYHSEYNQSKTQPATILQMWVEPRKQNIGPQYAQKAFDFEKNKLTLLASGEESKKALTISQDAYFSLGSLEKNKNIAYKMHSKNNGAYIFVISGSLSIENEDLQPRDAIGISDKDTLFIEAKTPAQLLVIEVPLTF